MANTTFKGPVRSEDGFNAITENSSTGVITTDFTYGSAGLMVATPTVLADGDITITKATHGGRINLVPDGGQIILIHFLHQKQVLLIDLFMVVELLMQLMQYL